MKIRLSRTFWLPSIALASSLSVAYLAACGDDGLPLQCVPCVSGIQLAVTPIPIADGESTLVVSANGEVVGTCTFNKGDSPSVAVVCAGNDLAVNVDDDIFTVGDGTFMGVTILGDFSGTVAARLRLDTPTGSIEGIADVAVQESPGRDCGPVCRGGSASLTLQAVAP